MTRRARGAVAARALLVLLAALALLAAGCRTPSTTAIPLPPDDPRAGALLAALDRRAAELVAVRGLARLSVDGPDGSLRSKQVLVAARPASLRVEILGFLSQTQALLVTDGSTYELFDVREQARETDVVRPGLLWEIAGIDLEPAEAVRVLLGAPDVEALRVARSVLLDEGAVRVLLVDADGAPRRALEFDAGGDLRRIAAWGARGGLAWDARYGDLETVGDRPFPHEIEIAFPATGVRVRLDLSRVALNPEVGPDTFRLTLPAGRSRAGAPEERA